MATVEVKEDKAYVPISCVIDPSSLSLLKAIKMATSEVDENKVNYGNVVVDWGEFDRARTPDVQFKGKKNKGRGDKKTQDPRRENNVPKNVHVFYRNEWNAAKGRERHLAIAYIYDRTSGQCWFASCVYNDDGRPETPRWSRPSHRHTALKRLRKNPLQCKIDLPPVEESTDINIPPVEPPAELKNVVEFINQWKRLEDEIRERLRHPAKYGGKIRETRNKNTMDVVMAMLSDPSVTVEMEEDVSA